MNTSDLPDPGRKAAPNCKQMENRDAVDPLGTGND
jgi:hypothetical protein